MKICQANQFSKNTIITICFNHFSSSLTMHAMFGALIYLYVSLNLVAAPLFKLYAAPLKVLTTGLSLRGEGRGFPLPTMNMAPGYFHRKIEEK